MNIGYWCKRDILGEKIILKRILEKISWGGKEWIDQVQDRDHCKCLVNTVMKLRVP
jgi:hypothetical protein